MRVFVQATKEYMPHNYNFHNAYQGFHEMGHEIVMFHTYEELQQSEKQDVVVGYVGTVRSRLGDFGVVTPEMDCPVELRRFLGRRVWETKLSEISDHPENWPVFVKPVENKKFTGVVVTSPKDLIGCGTYGEDPDVLCSDIVNFQAEWRCFVRYGKILDVRPYKGDWRLHYDPNIIEDAVNAFKSAPRGYAMDFGLTADGRTLMIEVNDGYALGCYGLQYIQYAKLLSARWAELTNTEDECAFDLFV